jgi:hypothetical protein
MEKSKRARKRKPETNQDGPEATNLRFSGGQVSIVRRNPKGMRRSCVKKARIASCCARDEGRPLETALYGEVSNCHKLLRSNGRGGERYG